MNSRSSEPLRDDQKFRSGVSIGTGMTYQLDSIELNGITYMDTPGLDDISKRREAAEAITSALKKEGEYKVVFVVTLESERVKPSDVTTLNLILESAPQITHYGVIFNKLGKQFLNKLDENGRKALITQISAQFDDGKSKQLPTPFFLQKIEALDDEDDTIVEISVLEELFSKIELITINSDEVKNIQIDSFEETRKLLEGKLDEFNKLSGNIQGNEKDNETGKDRKTKEKQRNGDSGESCLEMEQEHEAETTQKERGKFSTLSNFFNQIKPKISLNNKKQSK